jgi:hypothetical protein
MIYVEEFLDEYKFSKTGSLPATVKTAADKFINWQKSFPNSKKPSIISVQKVNNGIFVVYEK